MIHKLDKRFWIIGLFFEQVHIKIKGKVIFFFFRFYQEIDKNIQCHEVVFHVKKGLCLFVGIMMLFFQINVVHATNLAKRGRKCNFD